NGVYKLKTFSTGHIGIVAGEYTVTFSKMEVEKTDRSVVNPETGEKTAATRSFETLPAIYTSITNSPFTASVKKGERNTFDFDLKSKP
ncbi:MAG: hypothetical protein LBC20_06905, partial [Planctomycetaceae bacterium]|nr:hypothetical protein [Planctomycetaceae bacterium]